MPEQNSGIIIKDRRGDRRQVSGLLAAAAAAMPLGSERELPLRDPDALAVWAAMFNVDPETITPIHYLQNMTKERAEFILGHLADAAERYEGQHYSILTAMVVDKSVNLTRDECMMVAVMVGLQMGFEVAMTQMSSAVFVEPDDFEDDIPADTGDEWQEPADEGATSALAAALGADIPPGGHGL